MSQTSKTSSHSPCASVSSANTEEPHDRSASGPESEPKNSLVPRNPSCPRQGHPAEGSQPLANTRHEKFAQEIAGGESPWQAYVATFPGRRETNRSAAYRLKRRPEVARRIAWLQESLAAKNLITREELIAFLVATIRSKPCEAGLENPICELRKGPAGDYAVFMDKAKAIERLSKMMGWDAPTKVEHAGQMQGEVYVLTEERRRVLIEKKLRAMQANEAAENNWSAASRDLPVDESQRS